MVGTEKKKNVNLDISAFDASAQTTFKTNLANAAGNGPTARPANATLTPALVASGRDTATRLRRGGPALGTSRGCASTVPASPRQL